MNPLHLLKNTRAPPLRKSRSHSFNRGSLKSGLSKIGPPGKSFKTKKSPRKFIYIYKIIKLVSKLKTPPDQRVFFFLYKNLYWLFWHLIIKTTKIDHVGSLVAVCKGGNLKTHMNHIMVSDMVLFIGESRLKTVSISRNSEMKACKVKCIFTSSFLLLVVMPLLLVAMHFVTICMTDPPGA